MSQQKYSLAFNTRAALIIDTITIAKIYSEIGIWNNVKEFVSEQNILQARTVSTANRIYSEISHRLKLLTDKEMAFLLTGTEQEQRQIIWLAICKRYLLIKDFSIEVLTHRYDSSQYAVSQDDYIYFYNGKAQWHENLDKASAPSQRKARQMVFIMLRECRLINETGEIMSQLLSDELLQTLKTSSPEYIRIFPGALGHG